MRNLNYIILFLVGTLFMAISFSLQDTNPWASGAFSNIATGFYGSIIIYFLIERSLERSKQEIALTRVRRPLQKLLSFLCNIYKASRMRPEILPTSYNELFNDEYFDNIRYLDFEQDAPVTPRRSWIEYAHQEIRQIKSELNSIIETYGLGLDNETLILLENVVNCSSLSFLEVLPAILQSDRQLKLKRKYLMLNGMHEALREDVTEILKLLVKVNKIVKIPITSFRDDVAPKWGVNRTTERI